MRYFWLSCFLIIGFHAHTAGRDPKVDPGLIELIEKIDEKGSSIVTIRARFVQRKEISLLKEPVEMKGVFYLRKEDGIRFEFEPKDDLTLIITKEEMVSISPEAKKANRIKMKKRRTDLTRGILSEKLKFLLGYFSITRASSQTGNQHLLLKPSKRKLKKRFRDIQIWVNSEHLIHQIKVTSKDGDTYELALTNIELNVELAPDLFKTTIPDSFELGDRMEYIFGAGVTF